jgi:hypothetical protein
MFERVCTEPQTAMSPVGTVVRKLEQMTSGEKVPVHLDCHVRAYVGSVGHQLGICRCDGRIEGIEDPPGMTPRESVRAALAIYENVTRLGDRWEMQRKWKGAGPRPEQWFHLGMLIEQLERKWDAIVDGRASDARACK